MRGQGGQGHSATKLIEAGIDVGYAYKPLHHKMGHAFENTVLLLDDDRRGFDYPLVQFSVNCCRPPGQQRRAGRACCWR